MVVIENARLVERRIEALRARREALAATRGGRGSLPDWATEALVQVGMTRADIATFNAETATRGPEDIEAERRRIDAKIDKLEEELMRQPVDTLASLQALAEVGVARLRRVTATDPNDLFYDAGEAQALALLDRVVRELRRFEPEELRRVG